MIDALARYRWAVALRGAAALVFGLLAIVWLIGSYALLFGAVLIALALRLRGIRPSGRRDVVRPGAVRSWGGGRRPPSPPIPGGARRERPCPPSCGSQAAVHGSGYG